MSWPNEVSIPALFASVDALFADEAMEGSEFCFAARVMRGIGACLRLEINFAVLDALCGELDKVTSWLAF